MHFPIFNSMNKYNFIEQLNTLIVLHMIFVKMLHIKIEIDIYNDENTKSYYY